MNYGHDSKSPIPYEGRLSELILISKAQISFVFRAHDLDKDGENRNEVLQSEISGICWDALFVVDAVSLILRRIQLVCMNSRHYYLRTPQSIHQVCLPAQIVL